MKNKGLLVAGLAFLIAGSAYLLLNKKSVFDNSNAENFSMLKSNLGSNRSGENPVIVNFSAGMYQCDFYNNGRFAISKNKKVIIKGSYSEGGKTLLADNGTTAQGSSVWTNLEKIVK